MKSNNASSLLVLVVLGAPTVMVMGQQPEAVDLSSAQAQNSYVHAWDEVEVIFDLQIEIIADQGKVFDGTFVWRHSGGRNYRQLLDLRQAGTPALYYRLSPVTTWQDFLPGAKRSAKEQLATRQYDWRSLLEGGGADVSRRRLMVDVLLPDDVISPLCLVKPVNYPWPEAKGRPTAVETHDTLLPDNKGIRRLEKHVNDSELLVQQADGQGPFINGRIRQVVRDKDNRTTPRSNIEWAVTIDPSEIFGPFRSYKVIRGGEVWEGATINNLARTPEGLVYPESGVVEWYYHGKVVERATIRVHPGIKLRRLFSEPEKQRLVIDRSNVPVIVYKTARGSLKDKEYALPEYVTKQLEKAKAEADKKKKESVSP